MVDSSYIFYFDKWWPKYFKKTVFSVQTSTAETPRNKKQSFMPSRFKEFSFSSDDPGVVVARPYINSCVVHTFRLGKPNLISMDK